LKTLAAVIIGGGEIKQLDQAWSDFFTLVGERQSAHLGRE